MQNISAGRTVRRQPQPLARCEGNKVIQTPFSTAGFTAHGFLRHRFMPLYEPTANMPNGEDLEHQLFGSLALLEKHHALKLTDVSTKPYPYNVMLSYWEAQQQVCNKRNGRELYVIADKDEQVKFAFKETIFQDHTLYYIPVLPLYRLLQLDEKRLCAELLLSVCAYLCQVVNIPHYRDCDSYLGGCYDMLSEWLTDPYNDWDEDVLTRNRSALHAATHFGDIMLRKMYSRYNLDCFATRVATFLPADEWQRECLKVARQALDLCTTHPAGFLFRHINVQDFNGGETDEEDDDDYYDRRDNTLMVEQYIHFCAEGYGNLHEELLEMLNSEFNEKQYTQEPNLMTLFDQSLPEKPDSLDFERGLFELIDNLCDILYQLK